MLIQEKLNNIMNEYKYRTLKAVIVLQKKKESNTNIVGTTFHFKIGKSYYFIFEKSEVKEENDFLIIEMKKKLMPNTVFYEDIASKLNQTLESSEVVNIILM